MRRGPPVRDGVALMPDEFRLLRDLFAARTGLQFGPEARFTVERRLRERLMVLKLTSFAEYHHYLRFGARAVDEWDEAVDLLTNNETYFFREERQLRAFKDEIVPMLATLAKTRWRISVWSAGCSTGEEAYSVAILLKQSGAFPGWNVRVYGTDISRRCVTAARRGAYTEQSFRTTRDDVRRAYFHAGPGGWHVNDDVKQTCHFGQMNLLDESRSRVFGQADAIFCRNVLIYFDPGARKAAIELLYERLNPGGVLLLGHSESLLNVSTAFELLHLKEDLVYRKPLSSLPSRRSSRMHPRLSPSSRPKSFPPDPSK